jgi:hypothetical protein
MPERKGLKIHQPALGLTRISAVDETIASMGNGSKKQQLIGPENRFGTFALLRLFSLIYR